jgi:ribonuclease R
LPVLVAFPIKRALVYTVPPMSLPASPRVKGRIKVHTRGFGFLLVEDAGTAPRSAFIAPPDLNTLLADDEVEATLNSAADGRFNATHLTLVHRHRNQLLGQVVSHQGAMHLRPDKDVANTDWPLEPGTLTLAHGDHVVARLEGATACAVRKLDPAQDQTVERVLVRHGVRLEFPAPAQQDARDARNTPHAAGHRRDLRAVPMVTVDSPSTRDIDDAIGVIPADETGGLRLVVAIADASQFVTVGSALDEEARARATSVYLVGRVVPMLPDELSSDHASLHPGVDRLTLCAEIRLDPEGQVTAVDVFEGVMRSFARLNYTEVATWLDHGLVSPAMEPIRHALPWLRAANARLGVARARRGGVNFARDEARVGIHPQTQEATVLDAERHNTAHAMIERFMVAANEAVATWLHDRGVPTLYRVHDAPDAQAALDLEAFAHNFGFEAAFGGRLTALSLSALDQQVRGAACEPAVRSVMLRSLGPARYTRDPRPHFGLSAPLYLHFTSPLRRYADLLVHRTVKEYLRGQRDFSSLGASLEPLATHINARNKAAAQAESDRSRMLTARWMKKRVGEEFAGRVTRILPFGVVVQLDATLVEGMVPLESLPGGTWRVDPRLAAAVGPSASLTVGMPVRVRVVSTDEALGRVEFGLADTSRAS